MPPLPNIDLGGIPSGTPPNAAQNAAMRQALAVDRRGDFINPGRAAWLAKAIEPFETGTPPIGSYIGVGVWGDSVAPKNRHIVEEMIARYGQGALGSLHVSGNVADGTSLTGGNDLTVATAGGAVGVAQGHGAGNYWPTYNYYHVPVGGTLTFTVPAAATRRGGWKKISVVYVKFSGGGTVTVNVTQGGASVIADTIATDDAAGVADIVDFTGTLSPTGDPTIAIGATGATVRVIGVMLWRDRGVVPLRFCIGGAQLVHQNTLALATLEAIKDHFNPKLILHHMKEEDTSGVQSALHLDRMLTYLPQCSHVVMGDAVSQDYTVEDGANSDNWRRLSEERGLSFFDTRQFAISYADIAGLSWQGDTVHLSDSFYRYVARAFFAVFPPLANYHASAVCRAKTEARAGMAAALTQRSPINVILQKAQANGIHYEIGGGAPTVRWGFATTGAAGGYSTGVVLTAQGHHNTQFLSSLPLTLRFAALGFANLGVGATSFVQLGAAYATISAPNKALKGFGVEFARSDDVGFAAGLGNFAMRIWIYDGAVLHQSAWVLATSFSNTGAHVFALKYVPGVKLSLVGGWSASAFASELCSIHGVTMSATYYNANVHAGAVASGVGTSFIGLEDVAIHHDGKADPEPYTW